MKRQPQIVKQQLERQDHSMSAAPSTVTYRVGRPNQRCVRAQLSLTEVPGVATSESRTPNPTYSIALFGLQTAGWSFEIPLRLIIERDDNGWYSAADDEFLVYGSGESARAADHDYVLSLIDFYHLLVSEAAMNPAARSELQHLQAHVRPVPKPSYAHAI